MNTFNPRKMLSIEIESNSPCMSKGYTVWHIVNGERKRTMSRNADGKDFDFMNDKEIDLFAEGKKSKFKISATDAANYFNYLY